MKMLNAIRAISATLLISLGMVSAAQATVITPGTAVSIYNRDYNFGPDFAGDAGQGEISRLYEKFLLPSLQAGTAITSAIFTIVETGRYNGANNPRGLFSSNDDSWTANTLWSNKPALGNLLYSFNPAEAQGTLSFDITSFINSQYLGDGIASLTIAGLSEGLGQNSWTYFSSSSLTYTIGNVATVPEPASIALFGLGLLAFAATRRQRKSIE